MEEKGNSDDVKIIFPLDVSSEEEARKIMEEVAAHVDMVKVGLELVTNIGVPKAMALPRSFGNDIFADLKLIDIPNTMAGAARAITRHGVQYFNVMACGGEKMMMEAVGASKDEAEKNNMPRPKVIAVTVLTSLSWMDLANLGIETKTNFNPSSFNPDRDGKNQFVASVVMKWAEMAVNAGVDCLLSSPWEAAAMHEKWPEIEIFTPGIRLPDSPKDDQNRTATPYEAVMAGSRGLVIGRPIRKPSGNKLRTQVISEIRADIARALVVL